MARLQDDGRPDTLLPPVIGVSEAMRVANAIELQQRLAHLLGMDQKSGNIHRTLEAARDGHQSILPQNRLITSCQPSILTVQ